MSKPLYQFLFSLFAEFGSSITHRRRIKRLFSPFTWACDGESVFMACFHPGEWHFPLNIDDQSPLSLITKFSVVPTMRKCDLCNLHARLNPCLYSRLKNGRIIQCPSDRPSEFSRPIFNMLWHINLKLSIYIQSVARHVEFEFHRNWVTLTTLQPIVVQTQNLQSWPYKSR